MKLCLNCKFYPEGLEKYEFFKCPVAMVMTSMDRNRNFADCHEKPEN